jgi:hypothetical protein
MGATYGVITPLTSQELEVDQVARSVVGVGPSHWALPALTWAADEDRR